MVDTHAHLASCKPPDAELVAAAQQVGVRRILTVGMDDESNQSAIDAARRFDEVFAAVGRHPNHAAGFDGEAAAAIGRLAVDPAVRAIGETGLDYYRQTTGREDQRRAFEAQIEIARAIAKPLVIHMRDGAGPGSGAAVAACFAVLGERAEGIDVILHCFSAGPDRAAEAAERGWYVSFAGNLTYPKAGELREAAGEVPDELLLVETDSPYLSPQPVRGERNEPANVVLTAEVLADLRGLEPADLEAIVDANAARVLGW